MNEAETRAEHIDPALQAAGWGVIEGRRIRREVSISMRRLEGFGRRGKPLTADYMMIYRNTKLGVVEAKAWDEELTEGVAQAKNYAGKLAVKCLIPSLNDQASSINEAYTKIVRAFDPKRRSDTGNVFSVVYIEANDRMVPLDTLRERAKNAAAMQAARPRERCETWCELATTLSRVQEVWNNWNESSNHFRKPIPLPEKSTDAIEKGWTRLLRFPVPTHV